MSGKEKHICRLCLKVVKTEFDKVDGLVEQMFAVLLLKLELRLTRDPIICQDCLEAAKKCLLFKSTCIGVEQIILSFSAVRKDVKPSTKVIFRENNEHAVPFADEDLNICRFCLTQLERDNFVLLDTLMNPVMFEMLPKYIPEIDIKFIENPIICPSCGENLDNYLKFVQHSLDIERKIKTYCKERGPDIRSQVKLSNMGQFSFKDTLENPVKYPQICSFKQEPNIFEDTECVHPEAYSDFIKQEDELENKEEERINVDENSCKNLPETMFDKEHDGKTTADSNKMYKCSLCAYENQRKSKINAHMVVHKNISEIKTYRCSLCAYEAKRKSNLNKHVLIHKDISEIKMYKCSICAFDTRRKSYLREHVLVHKNLSEIKTHKCPLCSYEFKRKGDLNKHMLLIHKDISEMKMYKCSLCAFETKRKKGLKPHMLVHKNISEIKMQRCSLCTFETKWKSSVRKHMLTHNMHCILMKLLYKILVRYSLVLINRRIQT